MESHSVSICHLTRVNAPHLNYSHIGRYSIYQYTGEMKSSADFGVVYIPRWFTSPQTVTHPSTNRLIASQLVVEPRPLDRKSDTKSLCHQAACITLLLQHVLEKKTVKIVFCHNFVKFQLTLTLFGTIMAKMIKLRKVYSFSTSPNFCQCTTL